MCSVNKQKETFMQSWGSIEHHAQVHKGSDFAWSKSQPQQLEYESQAGF